MATQEVLQYGGCMTTIPQETVGASTEKVRDDVAPPLPPYHLFEKFGEHFLYDLSSRRFAHIDELAYMMLKHCLRMPIHEARLALEALSRYSEQTLDEIELGVELLAERGLLDVPDHSISEAALEELLEARYSGAWTGLTLALAETCNLNCSYCYCEHCRDQDRNGLMSIDVARQAIDWLFEASGDAPNSPLQKSRLLIFS